jgi:hypothetical protein
MYPSLLFNPRIPPSAWALWDCHDCANRALLKKRFNRKNCLGAWQCTVVERPLVTEAQRQSP